VILERLLPEAKRLLHDSWLPVAEIVYQLKFDDPSYLSVTFLS
jgi:AraC-like DNA-binding protein